MGDVFLDAFLDTLKILPFLLAMNFAIELLEYGSKGFKANGILKGGFAPLIGTAVGIVPQCGFSVVATELYGKRRIALGTLLAVYIATSDEALPIMLSSYAGLTKVLPVILIKVCFALTVGYAAFCIEKGRAAYISKKSERRNALSSNERMTNSDDSSVGLAAEKDGAEKISENTRANSNVRTCEYVQSSETEHEREHGGDGAHAHIHGCHRHALDGDEAPPLPADATKKQKAARVWNLYLKHPLLHTATVVLYILIVNVAFGITVYYVGEKRLAQFIGSTGYLQPLLAAAVGLIPNCASSVVITELYIVGGLNLGGAVAGLCVSAGIGYAVLIKQNRPVKNTVLIIALMYALSAVLGVCVNLVY